MLDLDEQVWLDGARLMSLSDTQAEWVTRRIDHVEFDDARTFEITTTLDIDLAGEHCEDLPKWRGRTLLPLQMLAGGVDAKVTDANGTPVPHLSRADERSFVAAGLLEAFWGRSKHEDISELYDAILSHIDTNLFGPKRDLKTDSSDAMSLLDRYRTERLLVAAIDLDSIDDGALLRLELKRSQRLPRAHEGVPRADRGRIEPQPNEPELLDDLIIRFPAEQISTSESYHWKFVAPAGSIVKEAHLEVQNVPDAKAIADVIIENLADADSTIGASGGDAGGAEDKHPTGDPSVLAARIAKSVDDHLASDSYPDDDPHCDRVHIYYNSKPWLKVPPPIDATVVVVLRPNTMGTTRPGTIASWLATIALVTIAVTIGWEGCPFGGGWVGYRWDVDSVVAILLLGPTLLVAFIIRENEHLLAKRVLTHYRRRIATQAFLTFTAAALYALGVPPDAKWVALVLLALLSTTLTTLTVTSYMQSVRILAAASAPRSASGPSIDSLKDQGVPAEKGE